MSKSSQASWPWYWMPVVVLVLGVVSLLLLLATNRIDEQLIQTDDRRVVAVERIQLAVTTTHLWLEELVTGDDVDRSEIASNLDRAHRLIEALLGRSGGDIALSDPALLEQAEALGAQFERFRDISVRREEGFSRGADVGIGSALDREFDRAFAEVLATARVLDSELLTRQGNNRSLAQMLYRTILLAWVAIVALAVVGLWTRERRRIKAEADLAESRAQLLQAQKLDAVGRLAGGIAHDINNYLGAIRAQSEILKLKPAPPERVVEKTDVIVSVVGKASSLIEQLLAFSRRQPIQPEIVNLNRVVEDGVGPMVKRLIGEDIRFEKQLEPELWNVKIDPSQIEQVIVNLVVNAREAMPEGGVVAIATANRIVSPESSPAKEPQSPGEYVELSVSDTGTGIERELQDKIFDPFFTTKSMSKSSGLGLSTVYSIVEQGGGMIALNSKTGHGTTFRVYLPRSTKEVSVGERRPAEVAATPGVSGRVLLVEDNDELRDSTSALIQALGYEVSVAPSAEDALAVFDRVGSELDVVITDVVMPGLNGKQLVDRLRAIRSDIKVLFVSGYSDDILSRHGIEEGDAAFLKKPFAADDLARKIADLLA